MEEPENRISFGDGKFDFAFALIDMSTYGDGNETNNFDSPALPPQIGEIAVVLVDKRENNSFDLIEIEGVARKCTTENSFELLKSQPKSKGVSQFLSSATCFDKSKLDVFGGWFSETAKFFRLQLRTCNSAKRDDCRPQEEIDAFFRTKQLVILYSNTYLDFKDFETPFKTQVDSLNYYQLHQSYGKHAI